MDDLDFELDVIELTQGCAEACSHCSESPVKREVHSDKSVLLKGVSRLCELEKTTGQQLFARFWFPFPASDPFGHTDLFSICNAIWKQRALKCYLLSLGWGARGERTAEAFAERPESLIRLGFTVSNFSRLAEQNSERHRQRLATSLLGVRALWDATAEDGRPLVFLSPQFVEGIDVGSPFSAESTLDLAEDVAKLAGFRLADWEAEGRVFARPIVGIGRARTTIGVTSTYRTPITAEIPEPIVSLFPKRPYSALLTLSGNLAVYASPRGILGRERQHWIERKWGEIAPTKEARGTDGSVVLKDIRASAHGP